LAIRRARDLQLIVGGQWHWGKEDTEVGGFDVDLDGTAISIAHNDQIYVWLT
jgi:hypothetical protein